MMSPQAALLLLVGISATVAWDPDCSICSYHNNIGFVAGEFCHLYYMCIKNPYWPTGDDVPQVDTYRWNAFCCAEGLAWDQEHLTCKRDSYCDDPDYKCPNITTTTNFPCPNYRDKDDDTKYFTSTYEKMMCPYGQVWSQEYCTCVVGHGVLKAPCDKLLHFDFNGTYDSHSCYNFAKGDQYGEPSLDGDVLCLNGEDQFLTIGFLNNWFAWNPQAKTFTLCVWFMPYEAEQTAAILNTNCDMIDPQTGEAGSVVDIVLENGVVILHLGPLRVDTKMLAPPNRWTKICVVFDNGLFTIFWDGLPHFAEPFSILPFRFAPNTHSSTTLGFKPDYPTFHGYIDDFCFFTSAKSAKFMEYCYKKGPSNEYEEDADVIPI